jgi:inorganic triphosphatase YgiF
VDKRGQGRLVSKAWKVSEIRPNATLAENARAILAVRIAEFYSYAPIIDREREIEAHHDLRVAAKRLRYTLELFRVVFGEAGERMIELVKECQEQLGALHDHDVRIALIEDELTTLAAEQTAALGRALAVAPAHQHEAITTSALRPPPDDPRRGLLALLSRQYASRHEVFEQFQARWHENTAAGLRAELVNLTILPLPGA